MLQKIAAVVLALLLLAGCCACADPGGTGSDGPIPPGITDPDDKPDPDDPSGPTENEEDEIFTEESADSETPLNVSQPKQYPLPETEDLSAAIDGTQIVQVGDNIEMRGAGGALTFVFSEGTWSVAFCNEEGEPLFANDAPAEVGYSINGSYTEYIYLRAPYSVLYGTEKGLLAQATMTSAKGSVFRVSDEYMPAEKGFRLRRTVQVEEAKDRAGYFTRVSFQAPGERMYADCEYFIPSRLYRWPEGLTAKSGLSYADTRMGLPMAMLRDPASGGAVSLAAASSEIRTKSGDSLSANGISEEYGYGSAGIFKRAAPAVGYTYPAQERGTGRGGKKYAVISEENDLYVELALSMDTYENFNAAMADQYLQAVQARPLPQAQTDLDRVYEQSMQDLRDTVEYRNSAWVLPFAVYLDSGAAMAYVAQSGYIGMQISLGAQLIRYGVEADDDLAYTNGFNMVNMWATTAVPEEADSGVFRCYNAGSSYTSDAPTLRQLCDGAEGMLEAMRFTERYRPDEDINAWWEFVYNFANFLVRAQNEDGSWYRAYDYGGHLLTENNVYGITVNENTLADAKYNTQIPIRFLCRMYEYTGEEEYLAAAERAGRYVADAVIGELCYKAGTLDTNGVLDREAGIYAMYAMTSLYAVTGEEEWLRYAEYAAVYAMSWTYTYDFAVANPSGNMAGRFLEKGYTAGLSVISHSTDGYQAVDNFMGYAYADFFKLYLWTGREGYLDMALLVQNCQKRGLDLNGEYGYCKKSFACEATSIQNLSFATAENGVWLPWISNANIEAMVNMRSAYGDWDIAALQERYSGDLLRGMLQAYGAGGYAL